MWCLTVKQPWASLVTHGMTRYIARNWCTGYRGALAIHAAVRMPRSQLELCCDPDMRLLMRDCGYDFAMELPRGEILGVVQLAGCTRVKSWDDLDRKDPAVAFGLVRPGRCVWRCGSARALARPIPFRGRLGLFPVPDDAAAGDLCHALASFDPFAWESAGDRQYATTSDNSCQVEVAKTRNTLPVNDSATDTKRIYRAFATRGDNR